MLIPTLGCPANCSYCWSSEEKSPIMSIETIKEVVEWLKTFRGDAVTFTFHGGEPLLAGAEFYREALPLLVEGLSPRKIAFAIQTNLWKMTPEIAEIFAEYGVPIGSSLDGPKELNDLQRGKGYYDKTMPGTVIPFMLQCIIITSNCETIQPIRCPGGGSYTFSKFST